MHIMPANMPADHDVTYLRCVMLPAGVPHSGWPFVHKWSREFLVPSGGTLIHILMDAFCHLMLCMLSCYPLLILCAGGAGEPEPDRPDACQDEAHAGGSAEGLHGHAVWWPGGWLDVFHNSLVVGSIATGAGFSCWFIAVGRVVWDCCRAERKQDGLQLYTVNLPTQAEIRKAGEHLTQPPGKPRMGHWLLMYHTYYQKLQTSPDHLGCR
jgi:hypothetical protein